MTANVMCPAVDALTGKPCKWTGERFIRGAAVSTGDGSAEHPYRFDFEATYRNDREAMTRKPCPRCGGRVELIPTTSP
jgi:hypothetical protein